MTELKDKKCFDWFTFFFKDYFKDASCKLCNKNHIHVKKMGQTNPRISFWHLLMNLKNK